MVLYVVAQAQLFGGAVTIVRAGNGRISSFRSQDEALRYSERLHLPRNDLAGLVTDLVDGWQTPIIDLDAALRWSERPAPGEGDPRELALAWEVLANANCAPPLMPFDPMGLYALEENRLRGAIFLEDHAVMQAGMKLSGILSEADRKGLPAGPAAWRAAESVWTDQDSTTISRILGRGIQTFVAQLEME